MTTKEASIKFQISENDIRKSIRDGMFYATKKSGRYIIDDEIEFIPIKCMVQAFLFQILRFKNNPQIALDYSLCLDEYRLKIVTDYLLRRGYISQFKFNADIKCLFKEITLTDRGIAFALGNDVIKKRNVTINLTFPIKIGVVNL